MTVTRIIGPTIMLHSGRYFALRECGVWLSVDGVQTMIGFGEPDEALAEAEAWAAEQLEKIRKQISGEERLWTAD